jgi:alpha-ketoglutarate-dependent taurine dioxygenase
MERSEADSTLFRDLPAARRRAVAVPRELVSIAPLLPGRTLPLLVAPAVAGVDVADWAAGHRELLDRHLLAHGALLFRGFGVEGAAGFERFAAAVCGELYGENPEHQPIGPESPIQTPVAYSPAKKLLWHNENSFNRTWPSRILFCCEVPAAEGGETPIADSREVYRRLPPGIREPFEAKGVRYLRNYSGELGLAWQTVFHTGSRQEVEARCRAEGIEAEWGAGGRLRTRAVRPAVLAHPATGEPCWFNQAQHWHPACLDPATRQSLAGLYGEEDLPRSCSYGDGSPIPDQAMAAILEVYRELEVAFPWQRADVLLLDNVLAAHARNPYSGERRILVALGDPASFPGTA